MKIEIGKLYDLLEKYNKPIGENYFQGELIKNFVKKRNNTLIVELSNGETIYPSETHPFMINDQEVHAKDCNIGDNLYENITIVNIRKKCSDVYVYDVELANHDNTYMLGGVRHHNTKVFNGLRALMLDNKVGPKKIPKDIMIVGAMNPFDSGTNLLTDHMKDVVDVIQADGNITETYDFFEKTEIYKRGNEILGIQLSNVIMNMFKETVELFKSKVDVDGESISFQTMPFYWTDNLNVVYISPREFQDLILGVIEDSLNSLEMENDLENKNDFNIDNVPFYVDTVQEAIRDKYTSVFKFILSKQKLSETDFMDKFEAHLDSMILTSTTILSDVFKTIKSDAVVTLSSIFERSKSVQEMLDYPDIKNVLENIIENNDVNDVISDIQDIVADTTHNNEVVDVFDSLVNVYKLLSKIDWSKYSAEITANISISFIEYSIKPTVDMLKNNDCEINGEDSIKYIEKHMQDFDAFKTMFEHAKENKTNMFY